MAAGKAEEPPASPLTKAADRIRASAQYLLAAFAAVGATLAAGLQLADIGNVSLEDDWLRAVLTFVGLALAVAGISWAIAAAASVSTASYVDLPWLIANKTTEARRAIDGDPGLRQGKSVEQLKDQVDSAVTAAANTYKEILRVGDPGSDHAKIAKAGALRARYDQELAEASYLRQIRADVLDVASYHRVRAEYEKVKRTIVLGAVAAAVGIASFAWGANAPDAVEIDPGEVVPRTPAEVTVALTTAGAEKFGDQIGSGCDTSAIDAIAFVVRGTTYEVVTEQTAECESVALTVTEELGVVVPRLGVERGAEGGESSGD